MQVTTASERARVLALGIELGEKATRIPGGLAVSRALGDHFLKSENSGLIADPFVSDLVHLTPADSHIILARFVSNQRFPPKDLELMFSLQ